MRRKYDKWSLFIDLGINRLNAIGDSVVEQRGYMEGGGWGSTWIFLLFLFLLFWACWKLGVSSKSLPSTHFFSFWSGAYVYVVFAGPHILD